MRDADGERARLDLLLDLLADEVAQRLEARQAGPIVDSSPPPATAIADVMAAPDGEAGLVPAPTIMAIAEVAERPAEAGEQQDALSVEETVVEDLPEEPAPDENRSQAVTLLARLALGLLVLVALINVPLNAQGVALARSIPSSASLVIRDGLLVQETDSPDVWAYRDGAFHWISSLDAFQQYRYRWGNVRAVEPGFLDRFAKGTPISVLLKCDASPHVYALESGRKRWVVDLATFQAEGYAWQDVKYVDCGYLRGLPEGETIPSGRGTPPPPLP